MVEPYKDVKGSGETGFGSYFARAITRNGGRCVSTSRVGCGWRGGAIRLDRRGALPAPRDDISTKDNDDGSEPRTSAVLESRTQKTPPPFEGKRGLLVEVVGVEPALKIVNS
jgi:hypothetical protein